MDLLADIHDWTRWVVLVGLVGAAGLGILKATQKQRFEGRGEGFFTVAMIAFDIQVTIGLILWFAGQVPPRVDHPWIMLVAVLVGHAALVLARRQAPERGYAFAGGGLLLALLLVAGGIPWGG